MRPREQYLTFGPDGMSDVELVALALGTGVAGRPARTIAADALERLGGVRGVAATPVRALAAVPGVGPARAIRLHAACQAGLRSAAVVARADDRPTIRDANDAFAFVGASLAGLDVEELHAAYLDRKGRLLVQRRLTVGSDTHTIVEPRQVFRTAVQCGAAAVVVAHNHPSGDPTPSDADRDVTARLAEAGSVLGVQLLDHLVVGRPDWVSLANLGMLPVLPRGVGGWTA